jgi:hypothetical protein
VFTCRDELRVTGPAWLHVLQLQVGLLAGRPRTEASYSGLSFALWAA